MITNALHPEAPDNRTTIEKMFQKVENMEEELNQKKQRNHRKKQRNRKTEEQIKGKQY